MNRFLLPLGLFALLAALLAVGLKRAPEKGVIASPLIGKPAPEFELPDLLDGAQQVRSRDLTGRWYLLNVWGTWCVECRAEHDTLLAIQRSGVVPIIGFNWKDDDAQALDWLARLGNPYEVIAADRDGRVAVDWGVYGAPESFLVDPQGRVARKHVGALTPEIWEREFLPLLKPVAAGTAAGG